MIADESKYRDFSHKVRNVLRLLKCPRVVLDENTVVFMKELAARSEGLRANKTLADKYQIEQLMMRVQPALEGRELSVSISSIPNVRCRDQR